MGIKHGGEREKMFLRHRKALIDYATPLLGSRDDAEDIVHDAFLRFAPDVNEAPLPPKTYLFRIVRNLSFNKRSRRKRETSLPENDIPWWARPLTIETPEAALLFGEQVRSVSGVIDNLPQKARVVLELYRFEGLTLAEIAARLGVSTPTAHRLLKEAMDVVKAKMALPK